jgi:hypothetical protein
MQRSSHSRIAITNHCLQLIEAVGKGITVIVKIRKEA